MQRLGKSSRGARIALAAPLLSRLDRDMNSQLLVNLRVPDGTRCHFIAQQSEFRTVLPSL